MKYCVDCRHMWRYLPGDHHPQCLRFQRREEHENPVIGLIVSTHIPFCEHLRKEGAQCGPEGVAWEERPQVRATKPAQIKWFRGWFT